MISDADHAALRKRLDQLEAESAIRRVMAEYMRLCDQPDDGFPIADLGALFTEDAVWEGRGSKYGAAFGRHEGREAIMRFIDSYRGPAPHFALNVHFLTSEAITAADSCATGRWIMLQLSTYPDGRSSMLGAALDVSFAIEDGAWRIAHFRTGNLFSAPWDRGGETPADLLNPAHGQ
jgi:hypothetical protein